MAHITCHRSWLLDPQSYPLPDTGRQKMDMGMGDLWHLWPPWWNGNDTSPQTYMEIWDDLVCVEILTVVQTQRCSDGPEDMHCTLVKDPP